MEEIKAGEYVRSLVNGEISKVLEVSNLLEEPNIKYYKTGKFTGFCSTEDYNVKHSSNIIDLIVKGEKHSSNIIDLIEVGDFVNGYRVIDIKGGYLYIDKINLDTELYETLVDYQVFSVVTKEQFANAEYRLEE